MNTKALWITSIAVIVIGVLIAKGMPTRMGTSDAGSEPAVTPTAVATFYDQTMGESVDARFYRDAVTFTSNKLGTMTLPQAISASGARYANADESIVFWNKGDSVFITQNGTTIFDGSTVVPATIPQKPMGKLPPGSLAPGDPVQLIGTWVWQKTTLSNAQVVLPKKPGVFAVTFDAAGRVSVKTDCNGFGGDYTVASEGVLSFGPFVSTLMYCEGSQEGEFTATLAKANRYGFNTSGNLVITIAGDTGTVVFTKK